MSQPPEDKGTGGGGRFVISHLRSPYLTPDQKKSSRSTFDDRFQRVLEPVVDVLSDHARDEAGRRVLLVEGELEELIARGKELPPDTLIEPELPRRPALAEPPVLRLWRSLQGSVAELPSSGAVLEVTLLSGGDPVQGARVTLLLARLPPVSPGQPLVTTAGAVSNAEGRITVEYDPTLWSPSMMMVEPTGGAWSVVIQQPRMRQQIELPPLPRQGPLGWWHLLLGATHHEESTGAGMRIGVIDTGVGPHPYLSHVKRLGAFLDGGWNKDPEAGTDARDHGTHVSGLIGARPPQDSGDYAGLVPGAELLMARVFTASGGGSQADITNAIDALAEEEVDLINMSLVGEPSLIEWDAIQAALQRGTLCVCAAGNQNGSPVGYPAGYPESVAVSALGLLGTWPASAIASLNLPASPDKYTQTGLFLASFSNIGPQLACTAPGNGIISTIPANAAHPAPYADMSGTSMSAPLTVGALAALLSRDAVYGRLPRDASRAAYARAALIRSSVQLGLSPLYQGSGLARGLSP